MGHNQSNTRRIWRPNWGEKETMLPTTYLARHSAPSDLNQTFQQLVANGYRVRQVFLEHDGRYMVFAELTAEGVAETIAKQKKERVIDTDAIVADLLTGKYGLRETARNHNVAVSTVFKIRRAAQENGVVFPVGGAQ
jgi:hypothetical protein